VTCLPLRSRKFAPQPLVLCGQILDGWLRGSWFGRGSDGAHDAIFWWHLAE
jgi:hypothetical protein